MSVLAVVGSLALVLPQTAEVCSIRSGDVAVGAPVQVRGLYLTDYVHFSGLASTDRSCAVEWRWAPAVFDSPVAEKLSRATSEPAQFPDTGVVDFDVEVTGEVRLRDDGRPYLWVTELKSLSIDGVAQ